MVICHVPFWMNHSTELPTHALLHFDIDHTVCTLSVKRIVQPPLPQVVVGCSCTVRWSGKKQYTATVLCLGKNSTRGQFSLIFTYFLLPFRRCSFIGQEAAWVGVIKLQWSSEGGRAKGRSTDRQRNIQSAGSDQKQEAQGLQGLVLTAFLGSWVGMLIRVGHRNVLIVRPLRSQLSKFYFSVQRMILKDRTFSNISSEFFLSRITTLFFMVVLLTKPCYVWE